METILRFLLALAAVPSLLTLVVIGAVLNLIALAINLPLSLVMWLYWRCGNWNVCWPVRRELTLNSGAERRSRFALT